MAASSGVNAGGLFDIGLYARRTLPAMNIVDVVAGATPEIGRRSMSR